MTFVQIFDMDNEQQRDNCLKEVQLHQVRTKLFFLMLHLLTNCSLCACSQGLDHPNIVRYLSWFIDSKLNELFIAVEWAEKGDLKLVIKKAMEDEAYFPEKRIV